MSNNKAQKIKPITLMTDANQPTPIYTGTFILDNGTGQLNINGVVLFNWFPSARATFSGTSTSTEADVMSFFEASKTFDLIINGLTFGSVQFTNIRFQNPILLEGATTASAVIGDRTIATNEIIFSVANLRDFHGSIIREGDDKSYTLSRGRLALDNDDYNIKIDKSNNHTQLQNSVSSKGGYIILYDGLLTSKKKSISFSDSQAVFRCLSAFISFLNGRSCSAIFRHAIFENEIIWSDFSSYKVAPYKNVHTWPQQLSIDNINAAWQNFYNIWQNEDDEGFLATAIHWYVEANGLSAQVEGSIILSQTALELIYNWLIIEKKRLLIGKDSENISAANKIRLILSQLQISYEVPEGLPNLKSFLISSNDILDAPDAFVQIRNAIVHAQADKRRKLAQIPPEVQNEALKLAVWYTELSLLYILKFDGKYFNRCSKVEWAGQGEEYVPWAVNKT